MTYQEFKNHIEKLGWSISENRPHPISWIKNEKGNKNGLRIVGKERLEYEVRDGDELDAVIHFILEKCVFEEDMGGECFCLRDADTGAFINMYNFQLVNR